jgi:hypothetical protein
VLAALMAALTAALTAPLMAAVPLARGIFLVVCVGIAFGLGRLVNYRRRKESEEE